ncbi:hypothetical protein IAR50_004933 [Cryptococcus sp. DSM 104548]
MGRWACRRPHPFTAANTAFFDIPSIPSTLDSILRSISLLPADKDAQRARSSFIFKALREMSTRRVVGIVIVRPSDRTLPIPATITECGEEVEGREEWEIAYDLLPEFWGKGLGTKMVQGALEYTKWAGVKRVCALFEPENTASGRLLTKAGFVKHGERQIEWPEEKGGGTRLCYEYKVDL